MHTTVAHTQELAIHQPVFKDFFIFISIFICREVNMLINERVIAIIQDVFIDNRVFY